MTRYTTTVDGEIAIRDTVFEMAPADLRFCFGLVDDTDAGSGAAGPLFKQNKEFCLFEAQIDDVGRAGPSVASPTRCFGSLAISVLSKDSAKEITNRRFLEQVSGWFTEKTIRGIRFRTFQPVSPTRLMGFTSYTGVINFDFEIVKE